MFDAPHLAEPGDESGLAFSRFVALLGVTPKSPGTFFPSRSVSLEVAWNSWIDSYFSDVLAPAFAAAFRDASAFRVEEIGGIDRDLEKRLPGEMAARSRLAGEPFFEGKSEMKASRLWERYAESVGQGAAPGNLPIVFAVQSVLFQLPLVSALGAYAWFEFCSREEGGDFPREISEEEKLLFSQILPKVTVAVAGNIGDFGEDSGSLRVV